MKYTRPTIKIEVFEIFGDDKKLMWLLFKKHHYLTEQMNFAARCFIAKWENKIVGFESTLAMPSGTLKHAWKEHRLVVLSDFQGLGIGISLSETIGELLISEGKRFYSKTANIKLGEYRNHSKLWKPTSKNMIARPDQLIRKRNYNNIVNTNLSLRICYSHEYIGVK